MTTPTTTKKAPAKAKVVGPAKPDTPVGKAIQAKRAELAAQRAAAAKVETMAVPEVVEEAAKVEKTPTAEDAAAARV
ncbi:hypothetical protein AMAG_18599 [Allomyces macrogynus ATCC 38327]|uniref:Uncharacterized protein n=1 Tax=Allomyces macrogynus (strain ATCC 38327) TaxID=578462 RepID=A0A0L0SE90_ALLM3|nr:hypothetical protein AMAG_18599 [Allomyces macrogynus ATCC 38327]|eukprot:KNE60749.1 hypothetical protein AMAG_18599 [Allomyces macrogynus ATCC 38327]